MNKNLKFHIFRYHLNPLLNGIQHINGEDKSAEDLKKLKNNILNTTIQNLNYYKDSRHPLKIEYGEDNIFVIKIAQKKMIEHVENFKVSLISNEPFVYVLINNNPTIQKIAISENSNAFSDPSAVRTLLNKILNRELSDKGICINIEKMFKKESFWQLIHGNHKKIQAINFKYIKPNLANISSSLSDIFKDFSNTLNSHESIMELKAPKNGHLENINESNEEINSLVDYISEGGGEAKVKIKGMRTSYSTKTNPIIINVDEAEISGTPDQIIEIIKHVFS